MESPLIVDIDNVTRSFGDVTALENLNLSVAEGQVTVLLGPNGAGKTTAIRMITGALAPDTGTAKTFGMNPAGPDGNDVRQRCGVVSAKPSLYERLSGRDNLLYAAELYNLPKGKETNSRMEEAASLFAIEGALDQLVGGYSTGMKTRLALARAVLHEPDLLLLDEPTSGLDPESALAVLDLIGQMANDGQSVLMCTHLLLEAEGLADEIVVMQTGTSLEAGRPADLAKTYWPDKKVSISATIPQALDFLETQPGVCAFTRSGDTAVLDIRDFDIVPTLVAKLAERKVSITSVVPIEPSLEDLYFAIRREHGSVAGEMVPPGGSSGRPTRNDQDSGNAAARDSGNAAARDSGIAAAA